LLESQRSQLHVPGRSARDARFAWTELTSIRRSCST
jgi:hypothetical protein